MKTKAYHSHWKTKDGRLLAPEEMETSHIVNALNMVIRTVQRFHLIRARELQKQALNVGHYAHSPATPDGAAMAAESEFNDLLVQSVSWSESARNVEHLRATALKHFPITRRMEEVVLKRRAAGLPERGLFRGVSNETTKGSSA